MSFLSNLFSKNKKTKQTTKQDELIISLDDINIENSISSKDTLLKQIATDMFNKGYTSNNYLQGLVDREAQTTTYLMNGVAIPHGTKEFKDRVLKTGVIIYQIPNGIDWNEQGDKVHLAMAIAANGDQHLKLLSKLTSIIMDEKQASYLGTKANKNEILAAFSETKESTNNQSSPFDTQLTVSVSSSTGIHIRPAAIISNTASKFKDTSIRLTIKDKTIDAKSTSQIINLGAKHNDSLIISAKGIDKEEAVKEVSEIIASIKD